MGIVSDFFEHFKNDQNFILVDPVLGDHGELYSSMTPDMVEGMRKLCSQAKVITPNLTEAAFLLGYNPRQEISVETAIQWSKQLSELGPEHVIITSAPGSNAENVATLAYNRLDQRTWRVLCDYIPPRIPARASLRQRDHRLYAQRRQSPGSPRPGRTLYQYGN